MSQKDDETVAIYTERAAEYAARFGLGCPPQRRDDFNAHLPENARVLDLGCGSGGMAAWLRDAGHDVVAIDASSGMVAEAKRLHGLDAVLGDFEEIPNLGRFDGIWAHFSLLHADRDDLPRHVRACAAALEPGGVLLVGMKTGTGMKRDALGRRYAYVTESELREMMEEAGLTIAAVETGAEEGFDGTPAPYVVMTARA